MESNLLLKLQEIEMVGVAFEILGRVMPRWRVVGKAERTTPNWWKVKKARHPSRFICPQITLVDSDSNKINPKSYTKRPLCFATWNVRSLVSDSSKLFQLASVITKYKTDLIGITETHMPGIDLTVLDNGAQPWAIEWPSKWPSCNKMTSSSQQSASHC